MYICLRASVSRLQCGPEVLLGLMILTKRTILEHDLELVDTVYVAGSNIICCVSPCDGFAEAVTGISELEGSWVDNY
jgi:hypothetical protein